jgi:hypothetical protein
MHRRLMTGFSTSQKAAGAIALLMENLVQILIACLIALLAGCALQSLSGQTESDISRDMDICTPPSTGGDPMLIAGTLPLKGRQREYKKCMEEKGYSEFPAMPKDPGPNSGG